MPHTYQPTDNEQLIATTPSRTEVGLPENKLVFCCFNQSYKIDEILFVLWLDILKQIPDSILWLLEQSTTTTQNLKQFCKQFGVNNEQIIFAPKLNKPNHLARLQLADLALDTRLYNGHTTTTDALWANVPVVTMQGQHFASRVSSSLISAIGLSELITYSEIDYKNKIITIAQDKNYLQMLKKLIIDRTYTYPLFDSKTFCENLESAYTNIVV